MCDTWRIPRLLVCRRKEGKYLTFVHAWWSSQQLCGCTWDPINKAPGRLSSSASFLPPVFFCPGWLSNAWEIRWSRRRKPVDEEKEKKRNSQLMLNLGHCTCASCYLCWLIFPVQLCCLLWTDVCVWFLHMLGCHSSGFTGVQILLLFWHI